MIDLFCSISKPEIVGDNIIVRVKPRKWFIEAVQFIAFIQFLFWGA
jgi:hypothetical protein